MINYESNFYEPTLELKIELLLRRTLVLLNSYSPLAVANS